jgi:hypothetical protein
MQPTLPIGRFFGFPGRKWGQNPETAKNAKYAKCHSEFWTKKSESLILKTWLRNFSSPLNHSEAILNQT